MDRQTGSQMDVWLERTIPKTEEEEPTSITISNQCFQYLFFLLLFSIEKNVDIKPSVCLSVQQVSHPAVCLSLTFCAFVPPRTSIFNFHTHTADGNELFFLSSFYSQPTSFPFTPEWIISQQNCRIFSRKLDKR